MTLQYAQVNKQIEELLLVEVLVLINRWAKVKNEFYYGDIDKLYEIKEKKIVEMLVEGQIVATRVIVRESPAFKGMREALDNKGQDLESLTYPMDFWGYLTETQQSHYRLLEDLVNGCGIKVKYPEDVYQSWIAKVQPELEAYELHKAEINAWNKGKQQAAIAWASENEKIIARSRCKKSFKKNWLKKLESEGFSYKDPRSEYKFPYALQRPTPPTLPPRTYKLESFENYVRGSIPEVEEAIAWAEELYGLGFPAHHDIDGKFFYGEFEPTTRGRTIGKMTEQALDIFQKVIDGTLTNPKEIYKQLTSLELDYFLTIGMRNFIDRWGHTTHAEYSKWHENNLDPTGYWLVEFQSAEISEISFHIPYDRAIALKMPIDELPMVEDDSKMGREISTEEKKAYPLIGLLKILGYSRKDFPYELDRYQGRKRQSSNEWENDEYEDDVWEDDVWEDDEVYL